MADALSGAILKQRIKGAAQALTNPDSAWRINSTWSTALVSTISLIVVGAIVLARWLLSLGTPEITGNFASTPEYAAWSLALSSTVVLSLILGWLNWRALRHVRRAKTATAVASITYIIIALIATTTFSVEGFDPGIPLKYANAKMTTAVFVTFIGAGPVAVGLWLVVGQVLWQRFNVLGRGLVAADAALAKTRAALAATETCHNSADWERTAESARATVEAAGRVASEVQLLADSHPAASESKERIDRATSILLALGKSTTALDDAIRQARDASDAAEEAFKLYTSHPVSDKKVKDAVMWYDLMRFGLSSVSAIIVAAIVSTGALRLALAADDDPKSVAFPESYVFLYGAFFSILFAAIFLPAFTVWRRYAQELVSRNYPIPEDAKPSEDWADGRTRMEAMLRLSTSTGAVLTSTLGIFAPLITGTITVFVSTFEA